MKNARMLCQRNLVSAPPQDREDRPAHRFPMAHAQRETRRLLALDRQIVEIASWLAPARLLNPTLASRQKALEIFRRSLQGGEVTDPVFDYLPLPQEEIAHSQRALADLDFGDTEVDDLLQEQAEHLLLQLRVLQARGTKDFGPLAAQLYGLPTKTLCLKAHTLLAVRPAPASETNHDRIDAWSIAADMQIALEEMGVRGWRVVVMDEMSARMSVSPRHREVRVKSDTSFTASDRKRLIVHELWTHVRRACNGFQSGLQVLGLGLPGYMATEEGVASYMEQKHGVLKQAQLHTYAYRALGADFAHHCGFAETFQNLLSLGASPGLAWDVTLRVKRGLEDTSIPGGFPKDYVYLHGREIVLEYLRQGGKEEDLFLGKTSLAQIPVVKRILGAWDFRSVATAR